MWPSLITERFCIGSAFPSVKNSYQVLWEPHRLRAVVRFPSRPQNDGRIIQIRKVNEDVLGSGRKKFLPSSPAFLAARGVTTRSLDPSRATGLRRGKRLLEV